MKKARFRAHLSTATTSSGSSVLLHPRADESGLSLSGWTIIEERRRHAFQEVPHVPLSSRLRDTGDAHRPPPQRRARTPEPPVVTAGGPDRVLLGVGVTILRDHTVLLGKRRGSHGAGEYSSPGGHLDHLESFEECARRETREECGIEIGNIRFQFVANVATYAPKHYVHIGVLADHVSGEPRVLEPGKCEGWAWYLVDAPPEPLFEMTRLALVALREGTVCFDPGRS